MEYTAPSDQEALPRKRGCFFYGCLSAIILALLVAILIFLAYRWFQGVVGEYTEDHPQPIPKVVLDPAATADLNKRVDAFKKAIDAHEEGVLTLTSDEVNVLIAEHQPELAQVLAVTITDSAIRGRISYPLGNVPGLGHRYVNGEADVKASLEEGVLIVTMESITVRGKPIPKEMMDGIKKSNLAADAYKNPKNAEMIRKLKSIEIKDGKLTLRSRAKAEEAPAAKEKDAGAPKDQPPAVEAPPPQEAEPAKPGADAKPEGDTPR